MSDPPGVQWTGSSTLFPALESGAHVAGWSLPTREGIVAISRLIDILTELVRASNQLPGIL